MKFMILALAVLPSLAYASGTSRVIESETKEVVLDQQSQVVVECQPGFNGRSFSAASALILKNLNLFSNTELDYLVYSDFPNIGDNCAALMQDFGSKLPAKLIVTRNVTEYCYVEDSGQSKRAHLFQLQSLSGEVAGYEFDSGAERLSDVYVENGTCP